MVETRIRSELAQLNALVGLDEAKTAIERIAARLAREQSYRAQGIRVLIGRRHLVFSGPAGVGKTKVARIFGQLCANLGALDQGHMITVDAADLTTSALNKTAVMREKCEAALDGILYIKNDAFLAAGILRSTGDLRRNAVDVVIDYMQNHRERLIVILDARPHQLDCLSFYSGLARHFVETIPFAAYTAFDLMQILGAMAKRLGLELPDEIECDLLPWIVAHSRRGDWRNAREVSDLFSKAIGIRAVRGARRRCQAFGGLDRSDFSQALAALRPDGGVNLTQVPEFDNATPQPLLVRPQIVSAPLGDSEA